MTLAEVRLWGRPIGAVSWDAAQQLGFFEYTPEFRDSSFEVAPLMMPLSSQIYSFPALARETFRGLPGMLSDSLPDRFGNALIDAWLARQGRSSDFNPVERLCYTGARGMGALEYRPAIGPDPADGEELEVGRLVELAAAVLSDRRDLDHRLDGGGLAEILRVGTSAGGARAKAVIGWNSDTNEVRSGQLDLPPGFAHWILKFDGVTGNRDKELDDPTGYGLIEYAYYLMAGAAGITMSECRILEDGARRHFMTRRFDRTDAGDKLHMQSLGALAHYDYNLPGSNSYEQAFAALERLELPAHTREQLFRRMVFNAVARNQDDHVKNIAFLMDRAGTWTLAPAYDVVYSYNPAGEFTSRHQMSLNGKRDGFTISDLAAVGKRALLKRGQARAILDEVLAAVLRWPEFAAMADVAAPQVHAIAAAHRLEWMDT